MTKLIVLGLYVMVNCGVIFGHSKVENGDPFAPIMKEAANRELNTDRLEKLEKTVDALLAKLEAQNERILHLEASKAEQGDSIKQLRVELNKYKRRCESMKKCYTHISLDKQEALHTADTELSGQRPNKISSNGNLSEETRRTDDKQGFEEKGRIRRESVEVVAFSVYLGNSIKNLAPGYVVKCSHIIINSGNAYNPQRGVFTTPVDGLYLFDYRFDSSKHTVLALFVDGVNQLDAVTFPSAQKEGMGGNLILLELKTGQEVWLEGRIIADGVVIGDDSFRYTTFSGVLLY